MKLFGVVAVAALALLPLSGQATSIADPIVFDFEDGLQGWELFGSAQRVQTQLLGGEWAIFGDGFVGAIGALLSMSAPIDLTNVGLITLEQALIDGQGAGPLVGIAPPPGPIARDGEVFVFRPLSAGNLSLLGIDVSAVSGVRQIELLWAELVDPFNLRLMVSFIDNITFHPVPEPSTFALLGLAIAGLGLRRSRSTVGGVIRAGLERLHRRGRGEE